MRHVVAILRAHPDLTKIEFEDGLIRRIIPERLDVESSLFGIDADLRAENQSSLGAVEAADAPSAVLTLSSLEPAGPAADEVGEMVIDVATPVAVYVTEATTLGEEVDSWIGSASPGSKLIVTVKRASGTAAEFDEWLESAATEIEETAGPGRVRIHRVVETVPPSPDLDAIVTVRFPTLGDLSAAEQSGLPALLGADVAADTSQRLLAFEHRFSADPNHWGATSPSPPSVA